MPSDDLENKSDEDLLKILDKRYSYPDALRVKAHAVLRAREQADAQQKHDETISASRTANKLSTWAISISVLSLIVAVIALYKPNRDLMNELEKLETELRTQHKVVSQPTNTKNTK